ncbi:Uncharacterised protein [Mycobacteroides abscessus subsp. abscessus]|nr:Uncharacterised protein [Mycobacteroides abscessus subsp. abscessus]
MGAGGPVGSAATVATAEKPLPGGVWPSTIFAPPIPRATIATSADARRKPAGIVQRSFMTMNATAPSADAERAPGQIITQTWLPCRQNPSY